MHDIVISASGLTKVFSGREVIHHCQMFVERGTIYGFLGRNGAGKTTVFKLLLGLLKPSAGSASVLGMDSAKDNTAILKRTGSLIETPVFYEHLSAADNLFLHLSYMGMEEMDVEPTLRLVGLPAAGKQPVSTISLGMRQRLAIARAIIHKPDILILDEPANGLDPVGLREMRGLFRQLVDENGMTILLSSHFLSEMEQLTDRIGVIVDGTMASSIAWGWMRSTTSSSQRMKKSCFNGTGTMERGASYRPYISWTARKPACWSTSRTLR